MDEQASENEEKMAGLITQKADLQGQMKDFEERLLDEEDAVADLEGTKKKMDTEIQDLRADVEDLEQSLSKVYFSTYQYSVLKLKYLKMLLTERSDHFFNCPATFSNFAMSALWSDEFFSIQKNILMVLNFEDGWELLVAN